MKLTQLVVKRNESWETPAGQLAGFVHLVSETGEQRIQLSPSAIGRILGQISIEVGKTARLQAAQVESAVEETKAELNLLENDGILSLPE